MDGLWTDCICSNNSKKNNRLKLIKCDAEGSEKNIIKGASKLIKKLFFNKNLHPSLWRIYGKNIDRPTLENLWVKDIDSENDKIDKYYAKNNNLIHFKERLDQVHSFTNKNILQFSQGPKGKWD